MVIAPLVLMWAYPSAVSDVGRRLLVSPPAPELQVDPARDLANFRAQEEKRLHTYYWVDKQKGDRPHPDRAGDENARRKGDRRVSERAAVKRGRRHASHARRFDRRTGRRRLGRFAPPNLAALAFHPHPGARLPLAARLVDGNGRAVALGRFFTGKPVVLVLEYLRCKSLCGLTLENVVAALDALPLDAGRDFQMLAISIDPRDTPADIARAEAKYLADYHHKGGDTGIHFLAGSAASVRQIADAIGFPYRYDADCSTSIFTPPAFIVAGPDGRISRYIFGVGAAASELRAGLADAEEGKALSPLARLFLLCHVEGAPLGRYTVPVHGGLHDRQCRRGRGCARRCPRRDSAPAPGLSRNVSLDPVLAAHRRPQRGRRQQPLHCRARHLRR